MKEFIIVFLVAVLSDNYVLNKFFGIRPFIGVSENVRPSVSMSRAVTLVLVVSTIVTWPLNKYILVPFGFEYLKTVAFITIIVCMVQVIEIVFRRYIPFLQKSIGAYIPLITTNCIVLGVNLINVSKDYGFLKSIANSLGAGVGFLVATLVFNGVRSRIMESNINKSFEGVPITLVAAGITSLAFSGFSSVIENIF